MVVFMPLANTCPYNNLAKHQCVNLRLLGLSPGLVGHVLSYATIAGSKGDIASYLPRTKYFTSSYILSFIYTFLKTKSRTVLHQTKKCQIPRF